MEHNYCLNCEEYSECDMRDEVNFCEDCEHYHGCDIKGGFSGTCDAGQEIECNNGFELKDY